MDIFGFLSLLGGLALFLYGMNVMGEGLEKAAGGKLQQLLEKITNKKIIAVLVGAGVTAIIQSSSATTVMVVGFVNSGIMKLSQAVGIILGANIGTTITAWLLSLTVIQGDGLLLNLIKPSSFSPILAIIGVAFIMFSKKDKLKHKGTIMIGFAMLMFGMDMMSAAVKPLSEVPEFANLLLKFSHPVLGMLAGLVLTCIIQSSSASVGILQALCITGAITYGSAIPIIMGQNIGTCVTAILSSIGASRDAKRAAFIHLYYNIIATTAFMIVFYTANALVGFTFLENTINAVDVAVVHSGFNIAAVICFYPISDVFEKLAVKTIKDKKRELAQWEKDLQILDERFLDTPGVAIAQIKKAVNKMGNLSKIAVNQSIDLLYNYDEAVKESIEETEEMVDKYEDVLNTYLMKLSSKNLTQDESRTVSMYLKCLNDFERMSDHAINILESAEELNNKGLSFSETGKRELTIYSNAIKEILDITMDSFENMDKDNAFRIEPLEDVIDGLNIIIKDKHIYRLRTGECTTELGFILSDISTSLERVSDHCSNLGIYVIQSDEEKLDVHNYLLRTSRDKNEDFEKLYVEYERKYVID